jgi:RND superfamily putative drug exporter
VALINVIPTTSPQSQETNDLVKRIRDDVVPKALAGTSAHAYVSGQTAAFKEIGDIILSRMPYFLLYILGVTFVVMAMAFRSIVIALKASVTTVLSALVGFGVLTFVVQLGHGLGLIGLDRTGPIESFVPPIAFAILFGLSMDYEVFLMSRVREEHVRGKDTTHAVTDGVAGVGRVVVAAALIMSVVFAAFILQSDRVPKEFGLLLAIAILTDALIMRMTIVPALLTLLHERSWMMPRWLDRVLPRMTIEPPTDQEERIAARPEPIGAP